MNNTSTFPNLEMSSNLGDFNSLMMSQEEMMHFKTNPHLNSNLMSSKPSACSKMGFSNLNLLGQKKVKAPPQIVSNVKDANYDKYIEGDLDDLDDDLLLEIIGEITPE